MTASAPLARFDHVCREFDDGAIVALCDVCFSIFAGDRVALLGKSGSGKSSLIHLLSGCDVATTGKVYWREEQVCDQRTWRRLRARHIGIVFQEFYLLPTLTAAENVELALMDGRSSGERRRRAAELLARVGLEARARHLPGALSGGERQRVAIARSLANTPALLLADEPTGNLDSANAVSIMDLLLEIQQTHGMALVLATHDEKLASRCRRRITIRDGRIVEDSSAPLAAVEIEKERHERVMRTSP